MELFMELFEVEASQVGHLHLLEVTPEPFHRIEVRRVRWQPLQLQAIRSHGSDILVHQSPSVDGRAIPDHQYRPLDLPAQVFQELHAFLPCQRLWTNQRVNLPAQRQPAHDRQVVVRLPLVHDRRPPLWPVRLDNPRQQVETRLIDENHSASLPSGTASEPGPVLGTPALDGFFVALDGPGDGNLRRPTQVFEQAGDVPFVVRDAELLEQHAFDTVAGPQFAAKAVSFCTVPEEVWQQRQLGPGQASRGANAGARSKNLGAVGASGGQPDADGRGRNAQSLGDAAHAPALLTQLPASPPPPLSPVGWGLLFGPHASILRARGAQSVHFIAQRSVKARRAAAIAEAKFVLAHLPESGESLHAICTARMDLTDVIGALLERLGKCDRMMIATLGYNRKNLKSILGWLDQGAVGFARG